MKRNVLRYHVLLPIFLLLGVVTSCGDEPEVQEESDTSRLAEEEYLAEYESDRDKWGFINPDGKVAIRAKYDQVSRFTEGLAAVNFQGRWGYINHDGEVVIPYQWLAAWPFKEGRARVTGFDGTAGFIDREGNAINIPAYTELVYDFQSGRARFEGYGKYGYLDKTGSALIEPRYDQAWDFTGGIARVRVADEEGLIDTLGNIILELNYERVYETPASPYLVVISGRFHFLNEDAEPMTNEGFATARVFNGGLAAVEGNAGWYLVDRELNRINSENFADLRPIGDGMWVARGEGGYALVDDQGNRVTEFRYQQINRFSEGLAVYRRNDLCGYLTNDGTEVLPPQYGLAWDFSEGYARAAFRDGIAYIDSEGRVPFIPRYQEIRDFNEGLAPFQEY